MTQQRIIFIGGLIALIAIVLIAVAKYEGMRTEIDSYKSLAEASQKEVKYWKDKEGRSHAQAQAAEATTKAILEVHNNEMQDLRKQIKGLNRNVSNLNNYITTGVKTTDTVFTVLRDTVYNNIAGKSFSYNDEWTNIEGLLINDSASLQYQVRDSLTFVTFYKKQGLFKPKLLVIEGISYNPHTSITGLKNITVAQPRRKRFGVGPYIGIDFRGRPSIGIGLQYNVFNF